MRSITLGGEVGGAIPFVKVSPAENEKRIAELLAKAGTVRRQVIFTKKIR